MAKRATRKPGAESQSDPAEQAMPAPVTGQPPRPAVRASVRRRPRERVNVIDTQTHEEIGRMLDLSDLGLRIESAKALRNGLAMDLLIDCSTPEDPGRHARIGVKVRWSAPGVAPGRFESGLQVKAMVQRDAAALRALYARLSGAVRG